MNDKLNNEVYTNVLIIGKSGVGKSSLLNYIFGEMVEKTGSGKPVTEEGIYPHEYDAGNDFFINLYDTWGLEPDKAERWYKLIMDEIEQHDCGTVSDWFHTIFYCISAKSERIEGFDKKTIKKLCNEGNNVILILTKADAAGKAICERMQNVAQDDMGIGKENIICVCSTAKKLLGSKNASTQFGKDEVINAIKKNAWLNICNKLEGCINNEVKKYLDEWEEECCEILEACITTSTVSKSTEWISEKLKKSGEVYSEKINQYANDTIKDAVDYYCRLRNKLENNNFKMNIPIFRANLRGHVAQRDIIEMSPFKFIQVDCMIENSQKEIHKERQTAEDFLQGKLNIYINRKLKKLILE